MSQNNIPQDIQEHAHALFPEWMVGYEDTAEDTRNAFILGATAERERGEKEMQEFAEWVSKNPNWIPIYGNNSAIDIIKLFKTETGK